VYRQRQGHHPRQDGRVAEVVVDVGTVLDMGGKHVAVHWSDFKTDNHQLTLDWTKEQLKEMTEYRLEDCNTGAGTSTSPATGGLAKALDIPDI
jgi:hypothetical protein